ncbi:Hypothetical predicted protein, partial [Podarcis lilfordi]
SQNHHTTTHPNNSTSPEIVELPTSTATPAASTTLRPIHKTTSYTTDGFPITSAAAPNVTESVSNTTHALLTYPSANTT